jgi:hypothetical protein
MSRREASSLSLAALALLTAALGCSRAGAPPRRPPLPAGKAEAGGPAFLPPTTVVHDSTAAAQAPATVVAVRSARHADFDRVTVELAGATPGYRVAWAKAPPRQCGSGEPVRAGAAAWLEVRLDPAQGHDGQGRATVEHGLDEPGLPAVRSLVASCDFEAVVSWVIGAPRRLPFRVLPLNDPPRLVVDIAHGDAPEAAPTATP